MDTNLVGIFAWIAAVPVLAMVLLLNFLCIDILPVGREKYEGLFYDVALSSFIGDRVLILGCIPIGILVLQRGAVLPSWLGSPISQVVWVVVAGFSTFVFYDFAKPVQKMDIWHCRFTVPVLVFLVPLMMMVTLCCGNLWEKVGTCALFAVWVVLVVQDFRKNRMNQQEWLRKRLGIKFPLKLKRR